MIKEQALCHIYRLGQQKEVKVMRYRIRGSFEEVYTGRLFKTILDTNGLDENTDYVSESDSYQFA